MNTLLRANGQPYDLIPDFAALARWLEESRLIGFSEAAFLKREWEDQPAGEEAMRVAKNVRGVLKHEVASIARGMKISSNFTHRMNDWLRIPVERRIQVAIAKGRLIGSKTTLFFLPAQMGALLAESALDLLSQGDLTLLRKCASADCAMYFYDKSKSHQRRWCSMQICGNRHKVAAHYKKKNRTSKMNFRLLKSED